MLPAHPQPFVGVRETAHRVRCSAKVRAPRAMARSRVRERGDEPSAGTSRARGRTERGDESSAGCSAGSARLERLRSRQRARRAAGWVTTRDSYHGRVVKPQSVVAMAQTCNLDTVVGGRAADPDPRAQARVCMFSPARVRVLASACACSRRGACARFSDASAGAGLSMRAWGLGAVRCGRGGRGGPMRAIGDQARAVDSR